MRLHTGVYRHRRSFTSSHFEWDIPRQSNFCGNLRQTLMRRPLSAYSKWDETTRISFCSRNGRRKWDVCYTASNLMTVIVLLYVWSHCLNWKEHRCNLHEECVPEFPTLKKEITKTGKSTGADLVNHSSRQDRVQSETLFKWKRNHACKWQCTIFLFVGNPGKTHISANLWDKMVFQCSLSSSVFVDNVKLRSGARAFPFD